MTGGRESIGATLRRGWQWWKGVARKIGDAQARIILTVFYYGILAPFALVMKWGRDPLAIKPGAAPGWRPARADAETPLGRAGRQY